MSNRSSRPRGSVWRSAQAPTSISPVTDASDAYKDKGVQFVRSVAMIDASCIVVIDQVHSENEHTLDLAMHLAGKWETTPGTPWPAPNKSGYSVLQDLTAGDVHEPITLRTKFARDRVAALTLSGDEPTQMITGTGVGETTRDRIPIALFRRRAKSTTFVWSIAVDGSPVQILLHTDGSGNTSVTVPRGGKSFELSVPPIGSGQLFKISSGS